MMANPKSTDHFPDENIPGQPGHETLLEQFTELADVNRRLRRKIFDLYTVFEISRHLSSMLDVETLIDAILLTCLGQMGVEGAVIFIADDQSGYLVNPCAKGYDLSALRDIKIRLDSPLVEVLLKQGKPLTSYQLASLLGDLGSEIDILRFLDYRLVAPMIMKNRLLGILFLPGKISGAEFYENDIEFLSLLMNQLSVALENARLYAGERHAREELMRTQQLLIASERLAALGKLSASIAHEVNNPLGIISNYLHILSIQNVPEETFKQYLQILKGEVKRIANIVRQLLDFYRPGQEELGDADLKAIIAETFSLLSHQLSAANIEVRLRIDPDLPVIRGSAEKLRQVFLNLAMNAKDFMPDGGLIEVKAKVAGPNIEITFADNGPGIPEETLPHIFEPFFTTKGKDGTGLGLAVCHGIIQWHQGTITAENRPDGGAVFSITLPILRQNER